MKIRIEEKQIAKSYESFDGQMLYEKYTFPIMPHYFSLCELVPCSFIQKYLNKLSMHCYSLYKVLIEFPGFQKKIFTTNYWAIL